jgi:hypothetical protein
MSIFPAFNSTVKPLSARILAAWDRWLTDPVTGAIVGVKNPNANGADARFIPVDLTADQIAAPTAAMLADIDATYRLNVAPYTRYQSDGTNLVLAGGSTADVIVPAGYSVMYYAPLTITQQLVVQGQVTVQNLPA